MSRRCMHLLVLCVCLVGFSIAAPRTAQAQFGSNCFSSSGGAFSAIATVYVGAPNVVFLIGNAVRLGTRPSKVWGVTGIVTGTVASLVQLLAMFGDTTPFCGDPTAAVSYNAVMIGIHVATFALGVANTVAVDHKRANAPPKKRRPRRRRGPQPDWRVGATVGARPPRRASQAPKARPVQLSCPRVYAIYEGLLKDARHSEDKTIILKSLMKLERSHFPCFFTKRRGRKLRKRRRRLLGNPTKPSPRKPTKTAPPDASQSPPPGSNATPGQGHSFSVRWGL